MIAVRAYSRDLQSCEWPPNFKPNLIEKYDGKANPDDWIRLYSIAIRAAGGDTYAMANYLPFYLEPAGRYWLNSLALGSIRSWGQLVKSPAATSTSHASGRSPTSR